MKRGKPLPYVVSYPSTRTDMLILVHTFPGIPTTDTKLVEGSSLLFGHGLEYVGGGSEGGHGLGVQCLAQKLLTFLINLFTYSL